MKLSTGVAAASPNAQMVRPEILPLTSVSIDFAFDGMDLLRIEATARVVARTGVEMEALTAVSVAALTVYDMCKAVDRGTTIERIRLEEKAGGKSGHFQQASASEDPSG